MKKALANPLFFCILAFAQPAFADCIEVFGKSPDETRGKAKTEIARNIISQVKSKVDMSGSSIEKSDGVLEEFSNFLDKSEIESNLVLFGFQEMEPPKRLENGEYWLKGCIYPDKAAKPYLDSLRIINMEFSNKKISPNFCKGLFKMYAPKVMFFERILEHFGHKDEAQIKNYKEIENECDRIGKGLFLGSNGEASELGREFAKALESKIPFKKGTCLRGMEVQRIDAREPSCKKHISGYMYCEVDVRLEGADCGGSGKLFVLDGKVSGNGSSEEDARRGMMSKLRSCNFPKFNEWKKELQPWMEK